MDDSDTTLMQQKRLEAWSKRLKFLVQVLAKIQGAEELAQDVDKNVGILNNVWGKGATNDYMLQDLIGMAADFFKVWNLAEDLVRGMPSCVDKSQRSKKRDRASSSAQAVVVDSSEDDAGVSDGSGKDYGFF